MPRVYQNGDAIIAAGATAPVTIAQAAAGKAELARMRRSLAAWLKYRGLNDQIMAGRGGSIPRPLLKKPGASLPPAQVMASRLCTQRATNEAALATQLHQLLAEVFDPATLPNPNLNENPQAAVQLSCIAVSGKQPGDAATPAATGATWMWPLVIVIGIVAFVIMTAIRSSADVAKEHEKLACIEAGACTDSGFWLKIGAVAVVGWIAWDRLGVRERVRGALAKK